MATWYVWPLEPWDYARYDSIQYKYKNLNTGAEYQTNDPFGSMWSSIRVVPGDLVVFADGTYPSSRANFRQSGRPDFNISLPDNSEYVHFLAENLHQATLAPRPGQENNWVSMGMTPFMWLDGFNLQPDDNWRFVNSAYWYYLWDKNDGGKEDRSWKKYKANTRKQKFTNCISTPATAGVLDWATGLGNRRGQTYSPQAGCGGAGFTVENETSWHHTGNRGYEGHWCYIKSCSTPYADNLVGIFRNLDIRFTQRGWIQITNRKNASNDKQLDPEDDLGFPPWPGVLIENSYFEDPGLDQGAFGLSIKGMTGHVKILNCTCTSNIIPLPWLESGAGGGGVRHAGKMLLCGWEGGATAWPTGQGYNSVDYLEIDGCSFYGGDYIPPDGSTGFSQGDYIQISPKATPYIVPSEFGSDKLITDGQLTNCDIRVPITHTSIALTFAPDHCANFTLERNMHVRGDCKVTWMDGTRKMQGKTFTDPNRDGSGYAAFISYIETNYPHITIVDNKTRSVFVVGTGTWALDSFKHKKINIRASGSGKANASFDTNPFAPIAGSILRYTAVTGQGVATARWVPSKLTRAITGTGTPDVQTEKDVGSGTPATITGTSSLDAYSGRTFTGLNAEAVGEVSGPIVVTGSITISGKDARAVAGTIGPTITPAIATVTVGQLPYNAVTLVANDMVLKVESPDELVFRLEVESDG